jgi:parallel beta-helix repeat protein
MNVRRHVAVLLALSLALLLVTATGRAAASTVLYVDGSSTACSDTGTGTLDQPYCTIGAAAKSVIAGQTVQVAAGTYPEAVTVPTSGISTAPITFTAAPGAAVTVSGQANGFVLSGRSWVVVKGFSVHGTSGYGISVSNSSSITLAANHVSYSGQPVSGLTRSGIYLSNVSDSTISGNTVDHNSNYGINVVSGSTRNSITGNASFSNAQGYQRAASGIRVYGSPGNTVTANICHDNEDSGIESYTGSNNTLVVDNVTYGNGDHGIDNYQSTGQRVIGNSVYKNVTAGINVEGSSTGATIANNIAVDNGTASPRTHSDIRVESGSTSGTTMDYDQVFLSTVDTLLIWNSVGYSSLSAFQTATGQEPHGIQADPQWRNRSANDLHLLEGSSAIDSADSGVSGEQGMDAEGNGRVDDPATPNTGAGPRPYDDRGAYEFQPSGTPIDKPPTAALSVTPSSGTINLAVAADASASTDTDATPIADYTFNFGDGSAEVGPLTEPTTTHTYTSPGTYTVTVTVRDTAGQSSTATAQVAVTDAPPTASLKLSPTNTSVGATVTADASGSTDTDATPITSYTFSFGDGSPVIGPQPGPTATHSYAIRGTFRVTVTVTDTAGNSSTAQKSIKVRR